MLDPQHDLPEDDDFDDTGVTPRDYTPEETPTLTWWHKAIGLLLALILLGGAVIPALDYFFGPRRVPWVEVFF